MPTLSSALIAKIAKRPSRPEKAAVWDNYVSALCSLDADALFQRFAIVEKPKRGAMLLANVLHETGGLTIVRESMSYRAERMLIVWPRRFPSLDFARQFEMQPEKLANYIYGSETPIGRNLGNAEPGDGWRYRGGGMMQTTGRHGYRKFGKMIGVDLENHPELIEVAGNSIGAACAEWDAQKLNAFADAGNFKACCNGINRGNPHAGANPIGALRLHHVRDP